MPERNLPVGTVTFLFSDIEGSTRLLQAVGRDAYKDLLERHNDIVRSTVGDAVVSTEGDSFFCAFPTPGEAVAAAIVVQRALFEHEWPTGGDIRVRMGLHTGEGVLGGDNYVGLDVHKAARIASAAHGGQVLVSDATRAQVEAQLLENAGLRDLGEHRLKDLAEPEHLYQLTISGLLNEFPAPNTLETAPTNLPRPLSSFVGRSDELQGVIESMEVARLVTLTGSGGSGKTRLAIEAARSARPAYPGGVYFAALATVDAPDLLAAQIATEVALHEQAGRPIEDTLVDFLAPRRALLILDNCEHLVDSAAGLAERLLRSCPDLSVLATSREALLIAGEQIFEVGSMALPAGEGSVLDSDAVQLFVARAAEVAPAFDPDPWLDEYAEICTRLDGIPLAIELAAARVGMLSPAEILARLEDRFGLLTSRSRTVARRHGTLEAAIDWSYDLLDDRSGRLLRSLAVFRGGFDLDAARHVCFDGEVGEGDVLDQLSELHDKSLLIQALGFGGTRFGLLETIREYAAIRLHESGEYEAVERRHREYYSGFARTQANRLAGSEQLDALAALEADHDNFRAAMRRSLDQDDFDAAADLAGWLSWFWYIHAHFTEGDRWAGLLLDSMPDGPGRPWLRLLVGAAQYDFRLGHYDRADSRLRTALRIAEEQDIPRMRMWAHAYLATNELYRTDARLAGSEAEEGLSLAAEIGDFTGYAYASFIGVGVAAWESSAEGDLDPGRAEELLDRLAPISEGARATGERNMVGHVLQLEAILFASAGETGRAAVAFGEAVAALTDLGTVGCACHCLEAIAEFAAGVEDYRAAARLIGASDKLRRGAGITVAPVEERFRAHATALCAEAMSSDELEAESAAGSALSLVEAAQFARQTLVGVQGTRRPDGGV